MTTGERYEVGGRCVSVGDWGWVFWTGEQWYDLVDPADPGPFPVSEVTAWGELVPSSAFVLAWED